MKKAGISTRDLSKLPGIEELRRLWQSLAMLDAILSPDSYFRYYSYDAAWNDGEQLGSMRNGSGDEMFAHFGPAGCWIKGFAHESEMSPYGTHPPKVLPGVRDRVPRAFSGCLREPAFSPNDATFCIWRRHKDAHWCIGPVKFPSRARDPDGSKYLLANLDGEPKTYLRWASEYYECDLPLKAIEHVYCHRPLNDDVVTSLNPEWSLAKVRADCGVIGYPV